MISRTLDSENLYREFIGIAETQDIPTGGRQHGYADRAQSTGDGLTIECCHTDPESVDVRHLTLGHRFPGRGVCARR
jgi:hypothetical protein